MAHGFLHLPRTQVHITKIKFFTLFMHIQLHRTHCIVEYNRRIALYSYTVSVLVILPPFDNIFYSTFLALKDLFGALSSQRWRRFVVLLFSHCHVFSFNMSCLFIYENKNIEILKTEQTSNSKRGRNRKTLNLGNNKRTY